jgi:hypothetical protein
MPAEPYTNEQLARILTDPNHVHDELRIWPTIQRLLRDATEVVICAAVRDIDGLVVHCQRHHHGLAVVRVRRASRSQSVAELEVQQGFVTSRGRFVGRIEALQLQRAAGIKSAAPGGYRGDDLYSEDMY